MEVVIKASYPGLNTLLCQIHLLCHKQLYKLCVGSSSGTVYFNFFIVNFLHVSLNNARADRQKKREENIKKREKGEKTNINHDGSSTAASITHTSKQMIFVWRCLSEGECVFVVKHTWWEATPAPLSMSKRSYVGCMCCTLLLRLGFPFW